MSKLNEPTQRFKAPKKLVTPSSRDSIASWLDVLTSMLSLSDTQREQVRDELEDHIRSRVDDLLITGTPEPEAIRTAVAELGETAELAKLISHAHTRTNPRRRIMNIALITAAIAGLSIGGFSWNNANTVGGSGISGQIPLVAIESDSDQNQDQRAESIAVANGSMKTILSEIARKFDLELNFSKEARSGQLAALLQTSYSSFEGEMTYSEAIAHFKTIFDEDIHSYNLTLTDKSILIESFDEWQRKQIETQVHSAPSWMNSSEVARYADSLESLLAVKHDLEFASIEVIGDAIVVAAPPSIQIEVLKMIHELDAIVAQRQAERQIQYEINCQRDAKLRAQEVERQSKEQELLALEFEQHVQTLQAEFDSARSNLLYSKAHVRFVEDKLNEDPYANMTEDMDYSDVRAQLLILQSELDEALLKVEENQDRYSYLRTRLLDSQYAQLFNGLE